MEGERPRKKQTNRPRNEANSRSPNKSRRATPNSSSDGKPKPKKKKKPTSVEDALEAKMRAKQKREKKSSSAEEALEAKIRKKAEAAATRAESRKRPVDREEEKIEEGLSDDYSDEYDHDEELGFDDEYSKPRGKKSAGISIVTSSTPPPPPVATDADGNALFTRGGGDVRNRPPPSQVQQQLDPLREAQIAKEKNKKKVNPKFADLHETGQWGGLTKWEKYGICLISLGALAAAIVVGLKYGRSSVDDTPSPTRSPTSSPSASPSASPTGAPTDSSYRETHGLGLMTVASPKLTLPKDPTELKGAKNNVDSTPQELAAEFVLYDDPMNLDARDPRFMERYALVVFYFQNGGCAGDWITQTKWLEVPPPDDLDGDGIEANSTISSSSSSSADHCNGWHGIVCDLKKRVIEINFSNNYVTGELPMEFGQLSQLSTLDLSNNALVGEVPAVALSLERLFTIQLNNNKLEGEFPFAEVKQGATILDNLWIQENDGLNGAITEAYCELNSITLDCNNFDPQPTYPVEDVGGLTSFEVGCRRSDIPGPKEYTCNFDPAAPFTKSPAVAGATNAPAASPAPATVCGTPAVNR